MGRISFLLLCFLLLIPLSGQADFYDGLRAFDAKRYSTALKLWRDAADQGDAKSQFRLGQLYQRGLGAPQNFVKAHLYYNLAGAQGDANARQARDVLAKEMTAEERAQARKLAANWVPKKTTTPSGTTPSTKTTQAADSSEQLEQLRKRLAKLKQDRKLATQSAPKKQSAVAVVPTSGRQAQTARDTYRIAVFPCDGRNSWRSLEDSVAPIIEEVHAFINRDRRFVLAYSHYDRVLREPRIHKPDRLWSRNAVRREPIPSLVVAAGRERKVDAALMCWVNQSMYDAWDESLPIRFYLFDISGEQAYQAGGIKQNTQDLLRGVLSEFLAGRQGQAVDASATQSPSTQQVGSTVSSQFVQSQPSQLKKAKRQKTKKRKAKTPYKLIATKQPGQASNFKDGVERIVSQQGGTVVMLRPSERILRGDLNLIVSVQNQTPNGFDFAPPNLTIHYAGQRYRAFTYDEAAALKAKKKTGFAGYFLMGMAQGAVANVGIDTAGFTQVQSAYQAKDQGIDEAISAMEKTYMKRTTVSPNNVFAGIVTFGQLRELGIGQPFEVWVTLPSAVHKFAFRVASP